MGVGYKVSIEGSDLRLKLGFTHDVVVSIPLEISAQILSPTKMVLSGCNLQKITQLAAKIRSYRKPEPYNGKGIFVGNETIKLKEGKKK